ncbi:MAG TPA: hypothetical protein VKQ29_15375 [Aliidongia sp.]|nr:hypothetical protein [Aliidongia sp.]
MLITTIGWLLFRQALDLPVLIGMALITASVLMVNFFSMPMPH